MLGQFRIATIAFHGKFQGVGIEKFPLYHSVLAAVLVAEVSQVSESGSKKSVAESMQSHNPMGRSNWSTQFKQLCHLPADPVFPTFPSLLLFFLEGNPHTIIPQRPQYLQFLRTESNHPNFILRCFFRIMMSWCDHFVGVFFGLPRCPKMSQAAPQPPGSVGASGRAGMHSQMLRRRTTLRSILGEKKRPWQIRIFRYLHEDVVYRYVSV